MNGSFPTQFAVLQPLCIYFEVRRVRNTMPRAAKPTSKAPATQRALQRMGQKNVARVSELTGRGVHRVHLQ
jgi:hypothetical protein